MNKKIIIIGGGIAGLSAGCYGQMNGYDTEIFEMHNIPGGMCTAWKRKGYTIDGCIHWLMGAVPNSPVYELWQEVGALRGKEFIHHEIVAQIEGENGKKLTIYSDTDKLEKELLSFSPADEPLIKEITESMRVYSKIKLPMDKPQDMYNILDYGKMIFTAAPMIKLMKKFSGISVGDYAKKFKEPLLGDALKLIIPPEYTMFILIMTLGTYSVKDGSWPIGGSLEFARGIEKRYTELGGVIHYKAKVQTILVEDNKAVGVRLTDGSEHKADYIISAADGYSTIFKMLEGKYINENIKVLYSSTPTAPTSVQVSLGVDYDLSQEPHFLHVKLDEPFKVGTVTTTYFPFKNFSYDKTMAPFGKSVVTSILISNFEYWEKLYQEPEAYKAEKEKIANKYIEVFEKRFPMAKGKIEVVDVSTPVTYVRYTGAWKGIYMGFMTTPSKPAFKVASTLPGLENFYMAGQFTMNSGGVPTGVMTGRWTLMKICRKDKKKFVAVKA